LKKEQILKLTIKFLGEEGGSNPRLQKTGAVAIIPEDNFISKEL